MTAPGWQCESSFIKLKFMSRKLLVSSPIDPSCSVRPVSHFSVIKIIVLFMIVVFLLPHYSPYSIDVRLYIREFFLNAYSQILKR